MAMRALPLEGSSMIGWHHRYRQIHANSLSTSSASSGYKRMEITIRYKKLELSALNFNSSGLSVTIGVPSAG
jgi:hypothetical protein